MKVNQILRACACAAALFSCWFVYESCTSAYAGTPFPYNFSAVTTDLNRKLSNGFSTSQVTLPNVLPTLAHRYPPNPLKGWNVFYSVGDGQWWMGPESQLASQTFYTFGTAAAGKTYAEVTGVYDDNDSPVGRITGSPPPVPPANTSVQAHTHPMETNIKLRTNRSPRALDKVTFIVTYQTNTEIGTITNGKIEFKYDPLVYEDPTTKADVDSFQATKVILPIVNNGPPTGNMTIEFENLLPGEQRNIFVHLKVRPYNPNHTISTPTIASLSGQIVTGTTYRGFGSSIIPGETVLNVGQGHDPNKKSTQNINMCANTDEVTFRVEFQNEGTDMTDSVVVKDILDTYLQVPLQSGSGIPIISATREESLNILSSNNNQHVEPSFDRMKREVTFRFPHLNLPGTHQAGYGTTFQEEDTKAHFSFKVKIKNRNDCSAIVNRAQVFFDCNTPVTTTTAYATFNCVACGPCAETTTRITKLGPSIGRDSFYKEQRFIPILASLDGYAKHWYPAPMPIKGHDTYTLVASKQCQRSIYEFKFDNECNLKINLDTSGLTGNCSGGISGPITATVTGGQGPWKWNDAVCTKSMSGSATYQVQTGDTHIWIGVQDEVGCHKEVLYEINHKPLHVIPFDFKCNLGLNIKGGTPPYSIIWKNGSTQFNTTQLAQPGNTNVSPPQNALESALSAVITDSKGCTQTVNLLAPNCETGRNWILIGLGAAAVAFGLWLLCRFFGNC
jgi:hypothetical protein